MTLIRHFWVKQVLKWTNVSFYLKIDLWSNHMFYGLTIWDRPDSGPIIRFLFKTLRWYFGWSFMAKFLPNFFVDIIANIPYDSYNQLMKSSFSRFLLVTNSENQLDPKLMIGSNLNFWTLAGLLMGLYLKHDDVVTEPKKLEIKSRARLR